MTQNYTEENISQPFADIINPYTNKPVQTGQSISFNQKIYNEVTPLQERNNKLNDMRDMRMPQSVNQRALYDIPVVPDDMLEEYREVNGRANWLDSLRICSEDEIDEWRAKGKIGIAETAQKLLSLKSAKYIPFVGTTADVGYNVDMLSAINRLKDGKEISDVERDLLVDYLRELKEIQVRGTTLPSKTLNAILESVPFFLEFGIGVAAAPETFGGSLSLSALALSKAAGRKAAKKAIQAEIKKLATESTMTGVKKKISGETTKKLYNDAMQQYVGRNAAKAISEVGGKEAAKIIAQTTPKSIAAASFGSKPLTYMTLKNTLGGIADRQLAGSVEVTDAGEAVFKEPENMALSIMKSFGSSVFDNYTETMGWVFAPVASYFAKPVRNILPKKFFTEFDKLVSSRYGMKAADALKKYGYDGVIEEMGEELLNRFLCDVFGIDGLEGYTFDGFMNNVFYANEPEQWLVEALSFAAMGGAAHGVHGVHSQLKDYLQKHNDEKGLKHLEELANKQIYSPAEFYLDQGLIKIEGSQSAAEKMLREKLDERGVDANTVDDFFKTATELQIRDKLKEFIDEENQDTEKRREKAVQLISDQLSKNQNFKNKKKIDEAANVFLLALEKFSETEGTPIEELIQRELPAIVDKSDYSNETDSERVIDDRLKEIENELENLGEDDFADKFDALEAEYNHLVELKNQGETYYQKTNNDKNLIDNFGMTSDELSEMVKDNIENILQQYSIEPEEFSLEDIRVYGSYTTGKNKDTSDLDFIVQYSGNMREDDAFNMLHDQDLSIEDKNGRTVTIDINPVNPAISGTIEDHIGKRYYQRSQYDNPNQLKLNFDEIVEQQSEQLKLLFEPVSSSGQNVQNEIKETYTEADIKQEKIDAKRNNNQSEIVDTGDSLLGNLKKDKKQYSWDELERMNDLLRKKYLSKSYIYELPSADELRKEKLSDRTIAFIYFVHSKINARPAKGYDETKEYQKIYFDAVHEIMQKTIDFAKKNNDLITNYTRSSARNKELFDAVFPDYENKKPYNVFTVYPDLNKKAIIVGGNKLVDALYMDYSTENDINKSLILVNKEKEIKTKSDSELEGWHKKFDVVETYRGWCIADRKSGMIISSRDLPTKDIAEKIAEQMYEYLQKQNSSFTVSYQNLRNYIPRRENNQNVKPEALIEVFGFRGINFGNWTKQSERQDFLNLAYDSLYDLAELLNLPPKALSLDGKLGLAFGAQGRSKAAGHFIPEYNEINLTRKSGAGALAHEWWHALDYYFGDLSLNKDFSGQSALGNTKQGQLRQEIFDALKNLDDQIKYSPLTEKEIAEKSDAIEKGSRRNLEYWANDIKKSFAKSKNADKIAALVDKVVKNAETIDTKNDDKLRDEYFNLLDERRRTWENLAKLNNLEYQCRKLQQVKELAAASKKYSKYYENAKLLNTYEKGMGSGYWTQNTELGARAFASYILDKMAKQNISNGFLVRDEKGEVSFNLEVMAKELQARQKGEKYEGNESSIIEWYPAEPEERKRIFSAFDDLFNSIQYEKTDRGYKLYQINNSSVYNKNIIPNLLNWTNKFNKVPSYEDIEKHIRDIIASGQAFQTLSPKWKIDIKGGDKVVEKITNDGNFQKLNNSENKRHNKYVDAVEELITNSVYKNSGSKNKPKPHVRQYHYFISHIQIGEIIYEVLLECEEWKKDKKSQKKQPQTVHLYNLKETRRLSKGQYAKRIQQLQFSIPAPSRKPIFNSNKNINNVNRHNQDEEYQENLFFDNAKARKLRNVKGSYIPAENLIELFKNADESTIVHEFAHWWLDRIIKYSENNEEIAADLQEIRKFVKNDGGEFTREQHEKFARGFETYIRSGYAKTNRLKKIFEDFKNALLSIYDSIKQLGFKDDDIPEIQGLFDRLLTTERERIKSTVFDKIAEIDVKIEDIRNNEENEFRQLDELWKNNLEQLNRRNEKKRSVKEYLELAEKMTSRETKEIKEFKQRYKDVTLNILSIASGKPKNWVANKKNWEKLQELIANVDDKITTADGFLPEWAEFYGDTGVSYKNDETDGDYKLAEQAFEVMADGRYNRTFEENYEFDEIGKFIAKLDYLYGKIKTLKGQEKEAAYEAYGYLFDNMPVMPDEVVSSVAETMQKINDEYEEEQKKYFNRKILNETDLIFNLHYQILKKLENLKIFNKEKHYVTGIGKSHKLYTYIKGVKSVDGAKKQIRRINEFVINDMRNKQRSLLSKEIQRQIKVNSKVVKVGTLTKGKFDWKTNTIFAELVNMNKMSRSEAEAQLGNIVQINDASKSESRDSFEENETGEFNKTNDFQENLRKKFLQYRSMKIQDLDVTHTMQLLQDILELKDKGRQAKSEQDFINKTEKWNTKNNLLDILEITKTSGAKFGANWVAGVGAVSLNGGTLANWESLLNAIFNKDIAQKYSLLLDEANSEIYARKHIKYFYDRAAKIYGFREANNFDRFIDFDNIQPIIKLFQEYSNEKYNYVQSVFSINSPDGIARSNIEISRAQMITMFAWSLNDQLEQRLYTQFGLEQIRDMFDNKLSREDRELAWALIDTCERMREDINEVFIRTTGLSLPEVQNYFPSKAERVQSDIDMYHDFFVKSNNPSFIKQRKVCNRIPMKPLAPLEILIPHINKTAKYVVMSEKVNFLNQIFKDTAIKTKMQEVWGSKNGSDIYQTLINKLAASTFTNYSKGTNLVAGALDALSRNYITSSIGFSPKVAIGQLLSVINYSENMPLLLWVKGFADTLKHPVQNFKYMLDNCEYLQSRLAGNTQNEVISILTSEKDKFRTLRNFMTSNTKWGDIIAITLGGKPYVDYLMQQKGMDKEAAFNKFVEDSLRAQQSGMTSAISEWQSAQAKNCLTRMFFAFRNTDMQYERKFIDTLIQAKKGEIKKQEAIKKLFIYKIFNPFMFVSFLQNLSLIALFRSLFDDDPEEALQGFFKSAAEAVMLSGMTAYGFAGFIAKSFMESLVAYFDDEYKHFETDVPVMTDFNRQVQKYLKGDLELVDYVEAVALGSEFAIGVPSMKILNTAGGIGNVAEGDYGVGLSRMAGWGNYTSTKAWTGKEPKKKRR